MSFPANLSLILQAPSQILTSHMAWYSNTRTWYHFRTWIPASITTMKATVISFHHVSLSFLCCLDNWLGTGFVRNLWKLIFCTHYRKCLKPSSHNMMWRIELTCIPVTKHDLTVGTKITLIHTVPCWFNKNQHSNVEPDCTELIF